MTKRVVIQVRCSEGEKAAWEREADRAGQSFSEWARRRLRSFEEAEREVDEVMAAVLEPERFVVPVSCPAPNTKKSFKPDFK